MPDVIWHPESGGVESLDSGFRRNDRGSWIVTQNSEAL